MYAPGQPGTAHGMPARGAQLESGVGHVWILLRILLYAQFLLGAGRVLGLVRNPFVWEMHIGIGGLAAIIALLLLKSTQAPVNAGLRAAARFMPLVALLIGLARYFDWLIDPFTYWLHVLSGIIAVGLVEAAGGQERRAQRS